jgi:5-(carboxyamino)imidazole ribonucleotide mutase/phosphoribosylaminoimidazole-succinocarboxamide synthase
MSRPLVVILMGSPGDREHARAIATAAERFGLDVEIRIGSAHRTPEHVLGIVRHYEADPRPKVWITVAGRSNALSGFTDPQVSAPVIACPPPGEEIDVWSSLRMPPGVASAVVLEPVNAALFAAKVLAVGDPLVAAAVAAEQRKQRERVISADAELQHG